MNIYIDCGAYLGDTVDCEFLFDFEADKKIAYEPNVDVEKYLKKKGFDEVNMKAVWIEDCYIDFFQDTAKTPMGSTLFESKRTGSFEQTKIPAIDFAKVLQEYADHTIVVKMDIEGAEFEVLEHLIKTCTDKLIHKLYVETHQNKVPEYTGIYAEDLLKRLSCEVELWH